MDGYVLKSWWWWWFFALFSLIFQPTKNCKKLLYVWTKKDALKTILTISSFTRTNLFKLEFIIDEDHLWITYVLCVANRNYTFDLVCNLQIVSLLNKTIMTHIKQSSSFPPYLGWSSIRSVWLLGEVLLG